MQTYFIERLHDAADEAEVVSGVRAYLAEWTPEALCQIPQKCRPGHVSDAEDICDRAFELTRARIASRGRQPYLDEMETFFAQACLRLSALDAAERRMGSKSAPA